MEVRGGDASLQNPLHQEAMEDVSFEELQHDLPNRSDDDYHSDYSNSSRTFIDDPLPTLEADYPSRDQNITKRIRRLFNSPYLSDVTFLVYDETKTSKVLKPVFAHSFVLCACSSFFRAALQMTPCRMEMHNVKFHHFLNIMRLVYVGWDDKIIPLGEVDRYNHWIRKYGLLDMFKCQMRSWLLKSVCVKHVNNIAMIYTVAWINNFDEIIMECFREAEDYPKKMIEDPNVTRIPWDAMVAWVRRPYTNATRKELEQVVHKWIEANNLGEIQPNIDELLELLQNTKYTHKGKMLRIQLGPGTALSTEIADSMFTEDWAEQMVDLPMVVDDHLYQFSASFDLMCDETIKLYGLAMTFVKHKNQDDRFGKCHFKGEVTMIHDGNYQTIWEKFSSSIDFLEEEYVTVECFLMPEMVRFNEKYTITVEWQSEGAYPDLLVFETTQSYIKTFGNCFVSTIWYEPVYRD